MVAVIVVPYRYCDFICRVPPERWHVASVKASPRPIPRFFRDRVVKKVCLTRSSASGFIPIPSSLMVSVMRFCFWFSSTMMWMYSAWAFIEFCAKSKMCWQIVLMGIQINIFFNFFFIFLVSGRFWL